MGGKKLKRIWTICALLLIPFSFLFSQTEEALNILQTNKTSVISLVAYGNNNAVTGRGSGFVIQEGVLVTSYQLVSQAESADGVDSRGKNVKVEGILAVDKSFNVALLRIKGKTQGLILGDSTGIEKGTKIFALGANELSNIVVSEGTIDNFIELSEGQRVFSTSLSLSNRFTGGPIIDINGQVLGVIIFLETGLKYVLPSNYFSNLRAGRVVKFKNWRHEDYLSTLQGAYIAGRIAASLDENTYARIYLERVVQLTPESVDANALLASVLSKQRDYETSIATYRKVIELDANKADAHFGLGEVYFKMRRFSDAIAPLERAVELNPDNKEAPFYVGRAYEELKEFARAAEAYERFVNFNTENAWEGYKRLGSCRKELGQFEAATAAFENAVKEKPQDIRMNYQLAQAYQDAAQYDKAEEIYKFLAKLTPDDAATYFKTTLMMYDKAGMSDKAIEYAQKVIEVNPQSEIDVYNLGIIYMKLERYDEAIETFNNALAINPNYDIAYYNIGFCYSKQKLYNESIQAFTKFVELSPDNADGWFNIGIGYMLLKQFDNALEPLQKTTELKPDYSAAYYNLAITYLNLQDRISAREIYNRLLTLDPELAQKLERLL